MVLALSGKTDAASALRMRLSGVRKHAPHVIDAEVGNVLRRHERDARLSPDEALLALRAVRVLVDHRYSHFGPLGELAWTWRHNLSCYDALYVALAVLLDLPLITGDVRLSRAPRLGLRGRARLTASPAVRTSGSACANELASAGNDVDRVPGCSNSVSYTHLRAHETVLDLVC